MLAIIPARGGSKGVPRKNIRLLGNKPLIHWTIEAAMQANSIDRVILSTDDMEIADICRPTGIEIPFMRPGKLAQDDSLAIDNYIYTLNRLTKEFAYTDNEFAVLLPTVPFRNASDIDAAINIFHEKKADSVISCTELAHPLDWVCEINNEGKLIKDSAARKLKNRQESKHAFIPNGGVYVFKQALLKNSYTYFSEQTYAYVMPAERSIDIDTEYDFNLAEYQTNRIIESVYID